MKYLSLFSGIEACSQAWRPIGWECIGVAEIDPFACEVLKARYPNVPNLGDVSQLTEEQLDGLRPDLIVFGSPCQSFSAAGRRLGLDDPRGNLAIVALGLVAKLRPKYFIFENVPGLLSSTSNGLPDFGSLLGTIRDIGDYGCSWRVIDAQHARTRSFPHAVAQRRRRLFVVGCSGDDWRSAAAILSIAQGLQGDIAPSRKKREGATRNAEQSAGVGSGARGQQLSDAGPEPSGPEPGEGSGSGGDGSNVTVVGGVKRTVHTTMESDDVSQSLSWREHKGMSCGRDGLTSPAVVEEPVGFSIMPMNGGKDYKGRQTEIAQPVMTQPIGGNQGGDYVVDKDPGAIGFQSNGNTDDMLAAGMDVSPTVRVGSSKGTGMPPAAAYEVTEAVAFDTTQVTNPNNRSNPQEGDPCHTLGKDQHPPAVIVSEDVSKSLKSSTGGVDREDMHSLAAVAYPIDSRNAGRDPEKHDAMNRQGVGVGQEGEPAHTVTSAFTPSAALAFKSSHYTRGKDGAPSDIAPPLTADADKGDQDTLLLHRVAVRRLTPEECEELQGMERGWTKIPWRGKPAEDCPDGPRYKAIGNSMAVNVMQLLGERIQLVEDIKSGTTSPYWD